MFHAKWHTLTDFRYVKNNLREYCEGDIAPEVLKKVHNAYRYENRAKVVGVVPPRDDRAPWDVAAELLKEERYEDEREEEKRKREALVEKSKNVGIGTSDLFPSH